MDWYYIHYSEMRNLNLNFNLWEYPKKLQFISKYFHLNYLRENPEQLIFRYLLREIPGSQCAFLYFVLAPSATFS